MNALVILFTVPIILGSPLPAPGIRHPPPPFGTDIIPRSYLASIPSSESFNPSFNHTHHYFSTYLPALLASRTANAGNASLESRGATIRGPENADISVGLWPGTFRWEDDDAQSSIWACWVPYCFENKQVRDRYRAAFEEGIKMWVDEIGSSSYDTHCLEFREYPGHDEDSIAFCLKQQSDGEIEWNPDVSSDALALIESANELTSATLGYSTKVPNKILIGDDPSPIGFAHEIGHVLGLLHEHERADRDTYVRYDCTKVTGYTEALQKAHDDGVSAEALCEDPEVAAKYGFQGSQYMKGVAWNENWEGRRAIIYGEGEYDVRSIMHYPSWGNADPDSCSPVQPEHCPLAMYKDPDNHAAGVIVIYSAVELSQGDIEAVEEMYRS